MLWQPEAVLEQDILSVRVLECGQLLQQGLQLGDPVHQDLPLERLPTGAPSSFTPGQGWDLSIRDLSGPGGGMLGSHLSLGFLRLLVNPSGGEGFNSCCLMDLEIETTFSKI